MGLLDLASPDFKCNGICRYNFYILVYQIGTLLGEAGGKNKGERGGWGREDMEEGWEMGKRGGIMDIGRKGGSNGNSAVKGE